VVFDLNGDGRLDRSPGSSESYDLEEKYVRLDDRDFEFIIEPKGDRLTLKPLTQRLAPDQVLRPGYPAPDFSFTDLKGGVRRLSEYRGKLVLLDFWFINCGPCQQAVPKLVEAYEKFHSKGLEIVGIDGEDSTEDVKRFMSQRKITWPQTVQEKSEGPIHQAYRFDSAPTYYLVGPDGKILARRLGQEDFLKDLDKLTRILK
jgi:peroxiredoxin